MVVSGGGTGGHLFPGIAVADTFIAQGGEVLFIGTDRMVDGTVLKDKPYQVRTISAAGIKGRGLLARVAALSRLLVGFFQSLGILRGFRPAMVIGTGGYVTVPVLLAARILAIPTLLHEQNSVPGLANRFLGRFVDRVMISMPGSERCFDPEKTRMSGNPVREEIIAVGQEEGPAAPVLLALGGSQGAHRINTALSEALCLAKDRLPEGFLVVHQTGAADRDEVANNYRSCGIRAEVKAFIEDMAAEYHRAALVVSRAGATSLAEICAVGRGAILIPYPHAADDHQNKNADVLVRAGAAVKIEEREFTAEKLAALIVELMDDLAKKSEMAVAAKGLARADAVEAILAECRGLIGKKTNV